MIVLFYINYQDKNRLKKKKNIDLVLLWIILPTFSITVLVFAAFKQLKMINFISIIKAQNKSRLPMCCEW